MGSIGSAISGLVGGVSEALTPQNSYQASNPLDQQAFVNAIGQSQGNFNLGQGQQQALAQTLQAQAAGGGPNPAQAMLNQATDQNIKQATGLLASQKGINPALAARQASENAGALNQQAAGQAATMNAQQQLGAQNQLGNVYANMAGQNLNNISNSAGAVNTAVNGVNSVNAGVAAQNAAANQKTASGFLGGLGSAGMSLAGFAHGGQVPHYADGGGVDASSAIAAQMLAQAGVPMWASGVDYDTPARKKKPLAVGSPGSLPGGALTTGNLAQDQATNGWGGVTAGAADNLGGLSTVPTSMGPSMMEEPTLRAAHGGQVPQAILLLKGGGPVPGQARVRGDSPQNDTVPALLSPGEVVIPRSKAQDPEKAKKFIEHLKKTKGHGGGFGKVLEAHRKLGESLKAVGGK